MFVSHPRDSFNVPVIGEFRRQSIPHSDGFVSWPIHRRDRSPDLDQENHKIYNLKWFRRAFFADQDRVTIVRNDPMLDGGPGLARERLLALAEQILAKNSVDRPLAADDRLTAAGMSSVDMVNLMLAVEAEFDITIPAADITPHNFRSISTIETLIAKITQPVQP